MSRVSVVWDVEVAGCALVGGVSSSMLWMELATASCWSELDIALVVDWYGNKVVWDVVRVWRRFVPLVRLVAAPL